MQWMPRGDLFKFARCSHQLWTQADSPFAFKFVEPEVRTCLNRFDENSSSRGEPWSPLLSRLRLSVYLDSELELSAGPDPLPQLRRLPRFTHTFTISEDPVRDAGVLRALASHPATQQLKELRIGEEASYDAYQIDVETVRAIAQMPQLTSLVLSMEDPSADVVRELEYSVSLTSLRINDSSFTPPSILDGLRNCVSLRHLSVRTSWLYNPHFIR